VIKNYHSKLNIVLIYDITVKDVFKEYINFVLNRKARGLELNGNPIGYLTAVFSNGNESLIYQALKDFTMSEIGIEIFSFYRNYVYNNKMQRVIDGRY
jgi:hypothetical protein